MNSKYKEKIYWRCVNSKNLQLTVTEFVCDFELGFKSAIETDFPQVRLWGCYFHFTKALLKKMKDLGLFIHYRDDPLLNGFLRKIFAIGYLPVFYVRQKFYQLTQSTNARFLKNAYPQLVFFLQYFEHTWFTTFPPNVYNVYARRPTLRTINACEGYNNRFNVRVGKRVKPNFWIFLKTLQKEEKLAKANYLQYRLGYRSPPQRKKMARLERSNFQLKKSIRMEKFEYRRLLDKYQSCLPEYIARKQI